jgi:hypothetical protein
VVWGKGREGKGKRSGMMPVVVPPFVITVLILLSNPSVNHGVDVRHDSEGKVIDRFAS